MHDLPTDWGALCALIFLLGMRHGLDADHLAAIDGLTRLNQQRRAGVARYCGALFSAGHGAIVLGIAVAVGAVTQCWTPPAWLDALGAWVSITFLLALGAINLHAVLTAAPGKTVPLVSLKGRFLGRFLGRLAQARSPLGVAAVGALFALSFDTVTQSVMFAATGAQFGGVIPSVTLGLLFVLGMLVTDGLNGWWMARLIARADEMAALASRIMGAAVAGVSLLVAALGISRLVSPAFEAWSDGKELAFGALLVLSLAASYLLARGLAARRPSARQHAP